MKVTIIGGYEKAKEHLYNKFLNQKKDVLKQFKLMSCNIVDLSVVAIDFVFVALLIISFIHPSVFKEDSIFFARFILIGGIVFFPLLQLIIYTSHNKYYLRLIEKQESMTLDEYIEFLNNSISKPASMDKVMIQEYEDLKKVESLLSDDITFIERAPVDEEFEEFECSFFVKRGNGKKELVVFNWGFTKYKDDGEVELTWEKGMVVLYLPRTCTNNHEVVQ